MGEEQKKEEKKDKKIEKNSKKKKKNAPIFGQKNRGWGGLGKSEVPLETVLNFGLKIESKKSAPGHTVYPILDYNIEKTRSQF